MKILIATGGTGGHIIPSLVVARELRACGHEIIFAGVFRQGAERLKSEGFEFHEIGAKGFVVRSLGEFLRFLLSSTRAFSRSLKIISKIQPDCVAGFGGYGAFWVVFAAALQGRPVLIQEQNVRPGKANRILSFFARKIAVGFRDAEKAFPRGKSIVTGCPCRPLRARVEKDEALKFFGLPAKVPVVLALGGSQGSRRVNEAFLSAVSLLKGRQSFGVIHIAGEADVEKCREVYRESGVPHAVFGFTDEIERAYSVADIVISRSGAMTVTELAAYGLPAILIPYPYAGGHQKDNASVLARTGVSRMIEEKDLTPEKLSDVILQMLSKPREQELITKAYEGIYRSDACKRICDSIERIMI